MEEDEKVKCKCGWEGIEIDLDHEFSPTPLKPLCPQCGNLIELIRDAETH